jgi:hypothetical protein
MEVQLETRDSPAYTAYVWSTCTHCYQCLPVYCLVHKVTRLI